MVKSDTNQPPHQHELRRSQRNHKKKNYSDGLPHVRIYSHTTVDECYYEEVKKTRFEDQIME